MEIRTYLDTVLLLDLIPGVVKLPQWQLFDSYKNCTTAVTDLHSGFNYITEFKHVLLGAAVCCVTPLCFISGRLFPD